MTVDTKPEFLIAKHVRKISRHADITEGQASVLLAAGEAIARLAADLGSAEAEISRLALSRAQENERSLQGLELDREFLQRVADSHGIRTDEVTVAFLERKAIAARSERGLAEASVRRMPAYPQRGPERTLRGFVGHAATLASNIVRFQEPLLAAMSNRWDRDWKTPTELSATIEAAMAEFDPRPGHGTEQDGIK